jgi:anti-sigma factor ChrR (cupin superfamily)
MPVNSRAERQFPPALAEAMLGDVAPADVPADAKARVHARVLARIGAPGVATSAAAPAVARGAGGFIDVLSQDGWQAFGEQAEMKDLFDDGVTRSWMVRLKAGAELPAHEHDEGPEECLVLQGDVWLDGRRMGPGDYQIAQQGSRHVRVRSETGCLLFVRSPSPRGRAAAAMAPA